MATWNADKPALANAISADVPDCEENLQELHDVITAITNGTLGTTTAADFRVDAGGIASNAVETLKIKDANVTAAKLASNAVETLKIKDANVTAAKLAAGVIPSFGSYIAKSTNTIYQAAEDGFVIAYVRATTFETQCYILGLIGAGSPPTTVLSAASVGPSTEGSRIGALYGAMTFPVKKDDYWEVDRHLMVGTVDYFVNWMPLV